MHFFVPRLASSRIGGSQAMIGSDRGKVDEKKELGMGAWVEYTG